MDIKFIGQLLKNSKSLIKKFQYVEHVLLDDEILDTDWLRSDVIKCLTYLKNNEIDLVLNLADRGPHRTANKPNENFEQCKYRLSNIPIEYKHTLQWKPKYRKRK